MLQTSYTIDRSSVHALNIDLLRRYFIKLDYYQALNTITQAVSVVTEESVEDIRGHLQTKEIVAARHILAYLLYKLTKATCRKIGSTIRDDRVMNHSSIVTAIRNISDMIKRPLDEYQINIVGDVTEIIHYLKDQQL